MDPMAEIGVVSRNLGSHTLPAGPARMVTLTRDFDTDIANLWDALTNPRRIPQWLMPISGDLRLGGHYQLEGNAGGEIRVCDAPQYLQVTWLFGPPPGPEDSSLVDVTLQDLGGGRTRFAMRHVATVPPDMWQQFGPGAVGVGWDLTLLGMAAHLEGLKPGDPAAAPNPMMADVVQASSQAWGQVLAAVDGADEQAVATAVAATNAFYLPPAE